MRVILQVLFVFTLAVTLAGCGDSVERGPVTPVAPEPASDSLPRPGEEPVLENEGP